MIVPDVNVLVAALHRDAAGHDAYATWLRDALTGPEPVGLVDAVLVGMVRLLTHPRVFSAPVPVAEAVAAVDVLRGAPSAAPLPATPAAWQRLRALAEGDPGLRGNLVPDAWIAALALGQGAAVATADRGFGRFPGLRSFDPARAA